MIFEIQFVATDGDMYLVSRSLEELDRNYDDEDYALILIDNPNSKEDGYFEINILKDKEVDGNFTGKAYVAEYKNTDDIMPETTYNANLTIRQ